MKILYILFAVVGVFILNILVYSASSGYRDFLKNTKGTDNAPVVMDDEYEIDAERILKFREKLDAKKRRGMQKTEERVKEDFKKGFDDMEITKGLVDEGIENDMSVVEVKNSSSESEIVLGKDEQKVLHGFASFNLTQLHSHGSLLDLTDEYPDEYFEYYVPDFTLVIFPTKSYDELRSIFEIEAGEVFSLNELDNFGDESFYLNSLDGYKDGYIRIILVNDGVVFGVKVAKNKYNKVKNILNQL